jgi:hypothetical protein
MGVHEPTILLRETHSRTSIDLKEWMDVPARFER